MIKVVFVLPSLTSGGAERVMSFLATNLNSKKFSSHLLIIGDENEIAYDIENCTTTFLHKKQVSKAMPAIVKFLRKEKPDIVISAIAHLNAALALISFLFPRIKFIGRQTSIWSKTSDKKKTFSIRALVYGLIPKRLDAIICQSEDMMKDLRDTLNYPEHKLVIINNPISNNFILKKPTKNQVKELITVGRLVELKGHKRILRILGEHTEMPFHYTIIGSGPEEKEIRHQIKKLKLEQKTTLIPFSKKIKEHLSNSDLFLQGSYSEGFPNGLLESCAVGTPVLTFVAPGGTSEIVEEGVNGFIAVDEKDFSKKIIQILNADWSPEQIRNSVISKYNEEKILSEYEGLFSKLHTTKSLKILQ